MFSNPTSKLIRTFHIIAVLLCVGLVLEPVSTDAALTLYVAPNGSDAGDGRTPKGAFASVHRARDEIRTLKARGELPDGGVTVELQPGRYQMERSFELTTADSGTKASPIFYRASQPGKAQLIGGRVLKLAEFQSVEDVKLRERLDKSALEQVVCISVKSLGLSHTGPFPLVFSDSGGIFELFWNGKRLPISRWPNTGWTTLKKAVVNGDKNTPGTFEYRDERPARWVNNSFIWLKGQWRVGWEDPAIRVATINTNEHNITFAAGIPLGIGNKYTRPAGNGKEPWCALNLIEEIDQPGEWAIDFQSGLLCFWPPSTEGELLISQLDQPLISADGAAHVRFIGLTLEASLGHGFVVQNADSNLIAGCTIRNLAKQGIIMNGWRSGVQSCDLYDLGAGCVRISGGDKLKLVPSDNFVVNNHMHHYGVLKSQYSAAVDVGFGGGPNDPNFKQEMAVGIRVANNLIHDAPRDALLVTGQDHVFELNEIFGCGFGTADTGSFYSWLDWTIRGVIIRHNFMHNTVGGVNPDDGASGFTVAGNIFAGPRTGVWIASGPDHTIDNNIFVKDEGPIFGMDDRGASRGYATNSRLLQAVLEINPTQPPWSTRFPVMTNLLASHPELPLRTKVTRNLIVMQKGEPYVLKLNKTNLANPALFEWRDNFVTKTDPGFVDMAKGNFALRPDAEVFRKIPGFKPIPFEKIGLFKDEYRPQLPSATELEGARKRHGPEAAEKNFGT